MTSLFVFISLGKLGTNAGVMSPLIVDRLTGGSKDRFNNFFNKSWSNWFFCRWGIFMKSSKPFFFNFNCLLVTLLAFGGQKRIWLGIIDNNSPVFKREIMQFYFGI